MYAPAVWGKDYVGKINAGLAFRLVLEYEEDKKACLDLSAKQVYKVLLNGVIVGYGPERTAHGYSKVDKIQLKLKKGKNVIVVEVLQPYFPNFYIPKEDAYFCAELFIDGDIAYTTTAFECYDLTDRIIETQRYSEQRTFTENYDMKVCRTRFYNGEDVFPQAETVGVEKAKFLKKDCGYCKFKTVTDFTLIETGKYTVDESLPKYLLPPRLRPQIFEPFSGMEVLSDTVSGFVFDSEGKNGNPYALYDIGREVSGFINLKVNVAEDAVIYVLFDEFLLPSEGKTKNLRISRNDVANVVKWKLKKGVYDLTTFEPYAMRYIKICVHSGKISDEKLSVYLFENEEAFKFKSRIGDKKLDLIVKAAQNTFAQNSVDMLIDCPSRERAGYINDVWFSRYVPYLFAGNGKPFESLLRAYALSQQVDNIPKGMLPMCYPSDFIDGLYISACAMWYVLCLYEFKKVNPDTDLVPKSEKKIKELLKYFKKFENEYELMEDLEGWIFVEWSKAGSKEHTAGVNFPTNMLYYRTLVCAGEMYGDDDLLAKAERIKSNIIKLSYNGEFFEDNAVRENGVLTLKRHLTEVCQYYAFDTGIADKETYPELYDTLMNVLVPGKPRPKKYADIDRANIVIGLCIRQKLGLRYGDTEQVIKTVKDIYYRMAERTLTLWEHVDERLSCNHGIAAFAAISVVSALTGYMGVKDGVAVFRKVNYTRNCRFVIPWGNASLKVTVKNKKLTVESKKIPYKII